ncbi:Uncharacterised protein [Burkholderia pseudomallei]|nr:Uncharacterised protein [Burkholderia pseudomallei]CFN07059.1 Uncharacterised protein [Burkholderia pseudomallei]CPG17282.1 Uncharacterised protein [Burkholderia pseudomallei]CPH22499.1 Uncharacterised protein [Burkholderia pseudomallei]
MHRRTDFVPRHERQRKQQLLFDQVDEIELARADDHIDFILVERKFLRLLFGGDDPVHDVDIERLRVRRHAALALEPRGAVQREPQIGLRPFGAVVLQLGLHRALRLPGEYGVALWRVGRHFV